ncbi:MAG: four helix bundle protein [Candidatus Omnitrophica bacterium]|nr:four helix bundle protein [Candidatus Omnitrophota bacterium]
MSFQGYRDIKAFQLSYRLAMDIFELTKNFPREEKYSLVDQIRRSSRSVPGNIAEAWKKRRYEKMFISKIVDSAGEAGETEVWLRFAKDSGYLPVNDFDRLIDGYDEVNRMLNGMIEKADKFCIN